MPKYINKRLAINPDASNIIKTLNKNSFDAFIVGGAVRDLLLNIAEPKDFDIATNATPTQIKKIFNRARIIGKRFQIVHIPLKRREFIEVSTFRGREYNTSMLIRDNNFGTIDTDANRRDFTINSMYYDIKEHKIIDWHNSIEDIKNKNINIIGDADLRFNQDPVRILRALRFKVKLGFSFDKNLIKSIDDNKHLLSNISPARIFEEFLKFFHSAYALDNFNILQNYKIFELFFPKPINKDLVIEGLKNTSYRAKNGLRLSPAFIFAILLYQEYLTNFKLNSKTYKNKKKASDVAIMDTLKYSNNFVQIPKFIMNKVANTWSLQHKLEQMNPKTKAQIIAANDFRMAYDFLEVRKNTIEPELLKAYDFWRKSQKL